MIHVAGKAMATSTQLAKPGESGWEPFPGVTLRQTLRSHAATLFRIAWSPDGKLLASLSVPRSLSFGNSIQIWDAISGQLLRILGQRFGPVGDVAWSPDGRRLACPSRDGKVRILDAKTGETILTLEGHSSDIWSVAWSPDGQRLVSGSIDPRVHMWNVAEGKSISLLEGHFAAVSDLAWSPDGQCLASTSFDRTVRLWDARDGTPLRTLQGHSDTVYSVAWAPDGRSLVSGSQDKTVRVWEAETGCTTNVLEGSLERVVSVAFSSDGNLLASGGDGPLRLWRCDSWQPIAFIPEPSSNYLVSSVEFHPREATVATLGYNPNEAEDSRDTLIHIWQLDRTILLGEPRWPVTEQFRQYTTAKIVLVGDPGVGKTGLGWRLAHSQFKEHASTHGQQFWMLNQLSGLRKDGTQCEAILWDLAGQPDYRLIHALFLDDADLALVVFDPTHNRDPLGCVDYWLQHLPPNCPKILVAARTDRGSSTLTRTELEQFCHQRGIIGGLAETSALTNMGVDELLHRMKEQINWDTKTATTTTATFKRIKDFVLELKENRADRQLLCTPDELRQQLEKADLSWKFTEAEMMTAVGRLAAHGYSRVLRTSDGRERILLVPELLNNLAASFIQEARRNPKGLGALEESRVLSGGYQFPELDSLGKSDRDLLLDATIVAFLENRLTYRCFRELLGETRLLVFPELMNLKKPLNEEEKPTVEDVSYTVTGTNENTYASLVVLLGYTNAFQRTDQWHNQARYEFQDGLVCGFRRTGDQDGEIDFVLFYGQDVGRPVRSLFQGLFESFLARKNLRVHRFEPLTCGNCQERFDRSVMRDRLRSGKDFAFCAQCGNRLALPPADEPIRLTQGLRSKVERQKESAEQRVVFEQALFRLNSFVESLKISRPTCFISYAWGDQFEAWKDSHVERWVARLDEDLRKAGVDVFLDQHSRISINASIQQFVDRIAACSRILVVGTPVYSKIYENRISKTDSIVAAEMVVISQRMLGTEEEKATVLPLLLSGNERVSLPPSLRRRVYADFRNETNYFATAFDLIVSLYGIPFEHPAVAEWRQQLRGEELVPRRESEEPEFSDTQLTEALSQIGQEARHEAFSAGRPVIVLKDDKPTWVYPDGTERPADSSNGTSSVKVNE
jgi:small GTP-binding protein